MKSRKPVVEQIKVVKPRRAMAAAAISSHSKAIQDVLGMFCMPNESDPVRVVGDFTNTPTALTKTFNRVAGFVSPAGDRYTPNSGWAVIRRNPLASMVMPLASATAVICTSVIQFEPQSGGLPSNSVLYPSGPDEISLPLLRHVYTWGANACPNQYASTETGSDDEDRMLLFNAGDALSVVFTLSSAVPAGSIARLTVTMNRFNGKSTIPAFLQGQQTIAAAGTTGTVQILAGIADGYYSIDCICDVVNISTGVPSQVNVTVTATSTSVGPVSSRVMHYPMKDIESVAVNIDGCRINASSLLWTNTTPAIDRGGNIAGISLAPQRSWLETLAPNNALVTEPYSAIAALYGAVSLDASNGMYGSVRPADPVEIFQLKSYFETSNGSIIASFGPLMSPAPDVCFAWLLPSGSTSMVTNACVIEFTSVNQWFERLLPGTRISAKDFAAAISMIGRIPNFTENPTHFKVFQQAINGMRDFTKTYKEARKTVNEVSPRLGNLLSMLTG